MKKILICLMLVLSLFIVAGCEKEDVEENKQQEEVKEIKVQGFDLTLKSKRTFQEMEFMVPENTNVNSLGTMSILTYVEDSNTDKLLFKIGLGKIEGKTVAEGMTGKTFEKIEDKKIGDLTWEVYLTDGKNYSYGYNYKNDSFLITFIYDNDELKEFEEAFVSNVSFK